MESIDDLIMNEWTSKYMNDKKSMAKRFRTFNKTYFENKILKNTENTENTEKDKSKMPNKILARIYELHNFTKNLEQIDLTSDDKIKAKELDELIFYVNNNYNNAFNKYAEEQKDLSMINLKDIKKEHILKLHKNFYKNHTLSKINFLITDMNSTIAYFEQKKKSRKNREYSSELKKIRTQYDNINFLISCLKDQNDIEDDELKQIANKEKFMSENIGQILTLINKEEKIEKRNKRFSVAGKTISILAIIAALWQIGNFSYDNRTQIKEYYNNKIKPEIYELKERTIDRILYKDE
jgi:hypothetical protein